MSGGLTPCRQLGPSHGENVLVLQTVKYEGEGGPEGEGLIEGEGGI